MTTDVETVIVGASAAGLAVGSQLQHAAADLQILEAGDQVADVWRHQYDRLHLHTPRSTSALPGLAMPRSWGTYPARDDVVHYLEDYERLFEVAPRFGERVVRIEPAPQGWVTRTDHGTYRSTNVVVATGRARVPITPSWPGIAQFQGQVLHSSSYRNGEPWKGLAVLVVGFGNSACEQALDLVEHGALVHMSVRSPVNVVPRDLFGLVPTLQVQAVLHRMPPRLADAVAAPLIRLTVGDLRTAGLQRSHEGPNAQVAHQGRVPVLDIGTLAEIRAGTIAVHGPIDRFTPDGVVLADGSSLSVEAVILATGYRAAVDEFLEGWEQVCDPAGNPRTSGEPSGMRGLYFCGMRVATGGMLREIGIEAPRIARHISAANGSRRPSLRALGRLDPRNRRD